MKNQTICLLCLFFLSSCQKNITSQKELASYVSNVSNGIKLEKDFGDHLIVSMAYVPEIMLNKVKQKKHVLNTCFFSLKISKKHNSLIRQLGFDRYSEMLKTFSFRMEEYVHASTDKNEKFQPLACYYSQTFGMTQYDEIIFVFDDGKILHSDEIKIIIDDLGLGIGNLDFVFKTKDIIQLKYIIKDMT